MSKNTQRDDALFEALGQSRKKRKRKILRTVIIVILVVAIVLVAAVSILRQQVNERFGRGGTEVLSYQASRGTINTTVSGSGSLTEVDAEQLTVPEGVEIDQVLVEADDLVEEGDVLATVNMSSVMSALSDIQAELDELDEQIGDAKGDEVSSSVKAGVSGRVKLIYAEDGTDVAACMVENGALALISLDGHMAADIETDALAAGDAVTVVLSDGKEIEGSVDAVSKGVATVLVSDDGPVYGEEVTVLSEDGTELGKSTLYIHNPLAITGYAGTVSDIRVKENQKVTASTTVFTLENTSYSAGYDALLRQRGEKEEVLLELLAIYQNGCVEAPFAGRISSVEFGEEEETNSILSGYSSMPATESGDTDLLTLCPNVQMSVTISVDETDILSLELGQEADVTVSSVSEEPLPGTVTEINKTAATASGITTYSAVVTLDKVEGMLPGMTADVDVKIEGVENAIIIPVDALHQTRAISYVYTSYDQETGQYGGMVEVTTGMQNSNYVEITDGLAEGTTVYYTESNTFNFFDMMSGMGGMAGGNFGGGQMPGGFGDSGGPQGGFSVVYPGGR